VLSDISKPAPTISLPVLDQPLRPTEFLNKLKYTAIVVPRVYYRTINNYRSIIFVLTASSISDDLFKFNTAQNGLLLGILLTPRCMIGECFTGWVSD
jgi:hypothetical protein